MKKIVFIFSLFLLGFSTQAQTQKEVKKKRNAKVTFTVDGICGMCKKRIETAALKTKGVKFAIWDVKSHQMNLIMDERKTDLSTIHKNIMAVGHDIILDEDKKLMASDKAYESVHPCCKYRDSKIVEDHNGELKKQ
ncbi:cation transporter [Polaribacter haliotis]|uniref:Cation transporter n=1 Tax=Polaribacter haliotis TaxID=1888915 RepID=A0A7L8AC20_9FLAO|nr:heavy-metal-associated domain-containing protein [Polaribacter haliotis]QOD59546.1 cation transporter [Polaribacter haliotis]